jgi:hypothetical protein
VSIVSNTGGGRPPIFADDNEWQNPFLIYYRDSRAQSPKDLFPLVVRYAWLSRKKKKTFIKVN